MNEEASEDPDLDLELLSATDPAAQANIMGHTTALRLMLTGRLRDEEVPEVMFGACFGINDEQEEFYLTLTQADGADRIMIVFDVDDPCGPPVAYGLFHKEGPTTVLYGRCSPWMAPSGNRALLVAGNDASDIGTFSYRPGSNLRRKPGIPSRNSVPGYDRALARMARLVASPKVREAVKTVYIAVRPGFEGDRRPESQACDTASAATHSSPEGSEDGARPAAKAGPRCRTEPRKPIPDAYNVTAWNAADIMVELADQLGIPLRETVGLDPQTLHDLVREHTGPDDLEGLDHIVIVDEETAALLKELMRQTIERCRPENRGVAHNVGITSRSRAVSVLGGEPWTTRALGVLDTGMSDATGDPVVVLEDADFDAYGFEMNRIISERPHGRSPVLD